MVKLQPKKAVAFSSAAERKLMEELEQMKVRGAKKLLGIIRGDGWLRGRTVCPLVKSVQCASLLEGFPPLEILCCTS